MLQVASPLRDKLQLGLPGLYSQGIFLSLYLTFFSLVILPSLAVANLFHVPACMQTLNYRSLTQTAYRAIESLIIVRGIYPKATIDRTSK